MFDCEFTGEIYHFKSKYERVAAVDVRKVGLNAPFEEEQEDSHQQFSVFMFAKIVEHKINGPYL